MVYKDYYNIAAFVEDDQFTVSGNQLLVVENQIIVTIQDNETNRTKFAVNNKFDLMDKKWKVRNDNRTKKGWLIIAVKKLCRLLHICKPPLIIGNN